MSEQAKCGLCGEPMPEGEEMFNYHGYSGPCPKPPSGRCEHVFSKQSGCCIRCDAPEFAESAPPVETPSVAQETTKMPKQKRCQAGHALKGHGWILFYRPSDAKKYRQCLNNSNTKAKNEECNKPGDPPSIQLCAECDYQSQKQ